jgi:hypothetical protein
VAPFICLLQSVTGRCICGNTTGGKNMKQPAPYEIQSYILLAIHKHNAELSAQLDAGDIEYDQQLKAAFPANAYSVIAEGIQRSLGEYHEA